ncbi:MAG: uncharacterized protein QOK19_925 [Solirubrobacteraceae bacterium]|nr:hypothetical protein [Solirubrobacterales bacterium]MEA2215364.1 uncharacterized protein [Solirubrobacteraceae bacterium]
MYEGTVRHRRLGGTAGTLHYEFRHRLFMAYLDLEELPRVLGDGLLSSARHPALAWFRRADHLGDPARDLAESVRELVAERTGHRPDGPIGLLTHLRCFGHNFNPVSFYWCFAADGERVQAVIAHVTNTPWGESHSYVLDIEAPSDHGSVTLARGSFEKELHVSPLMGMGHVYDLRMSEPRGRLSVHIESTSAGTGEERIPVFDATLSLERREWSPRELRRLLVRYPLQTVGILARIYSHALRLRLRGAVYHPHPRGTVPA